MSWIIVAISAYLILATTNLLDKFLVESFLRNSRAYAFIACIMGLAVFAVSPWFLVWPGYYLFIFNLFNGAIFAVALWFLYEALYRGEASRILVLIGGLTPVFSLFFSITLFGEKFSDNQWLGMAVLLIGIFTIAFLPAPRSYLSRVLSKLKLSQAATKSGVRLAVGSALAYSLYFISTKQAYVDQPFMSAFIWNRLGAAIFVLLFLISKSDRQAIIETLRRPSPNRNKFLVFLNQGLGSLGFLLQNYAVSLGSVVLVNALQGIQYVFLLVISAGLALLAPKLLKETFSWRIIIQKAFAVILITIGLYLIAF